MSSSLAKAIRFFHRVNSEICLRIQISGRLLAKNTLVSMFNGETKNINTMKLDINFMG